MICNYWLGDILSPWFIQVSAKLLRNEVVGITQNAKPLKSILTKAERDDLKILMSNKDIMFLPVDKGKAVVVRDCSEYNAQSEKL